MEHFLDSEYTTQQLKQNKIQKFIATKSVIFTLDRTAYIAYSRSNSIRDGKSWYNSRVIPLNMCDWKHIPGCVWWL